MSKLLLISKDELQVDNLYNDLNRLGYNVQIKKVKDWEDEEESDEDYIDLQKMASKRKNPSIVKRLLNNEI
jgi:hypothetical protein